MPGYKGHLVGGMITFAVVFYLMQNYCSDAMVAMQWLSCTLVGSLFPDIDVKSKGQKYFYWIVLSILILLLIFGQLEILAVFGIASITPMLSKHRGLFHEAWFIAALCALTWIGLSLAIPNSSHDFFFYFFFFCLGAFSHLYLDRGWRGLWPKKRFKKF